MMNLPRRVASLFFFLSVAAFFPLVAFAADTPKEFKNPLGPGPGSPGPAPAPAPNNPPPGKSGPPPALEKSAEPFFLGCEATPPASLIHYQWKARPTGEKPDALYQDVPFALGIPAIVRHEGGIARISYRVTVQWDNALEDWIKDGRKFNPTDSGLYNADNKPLPDGSVFFDDYGHDWSQNKWTKVSLDKDAKLPTYSMRSGLRIETETKHVPFAKGSSWDSFVLAPSVPGRYVVWLALDFVGDWPKKEPKRESLRGKFCVDVLVTRTERPAQDEEIAWLFGRDKKRPADMPDDKFFLAGTYEVPFTIKRDAWVFHHSEVVPLRGSVKQPKTQFSLYSAETNTEATSSVSAGSVGVGLKLQSQTWEGQVRGAGIPMIYQETDQWTINLPSEIPDYSFATMTATGKKDKQFWAGKYTFKEPNPTDSGHQELYRWDWMPEAESNTGSNQSARVWYAWHTEPEKERKSSADRLQYFIGEYGPDTKTFWFEDYRKDTYDGPTSGDPFKFVVFGNPPAADDGIRTVTITHTNAYPVLAYNVGPWRVIGYYTRLGHRSEGGGGATPKIGEATVVSDKDDFWKWFLTFAPVLSDNMLKVTRARINAHLDAEPLLELLSRQKRLTLSLSTEPEPEELSKHASTQDWLKQKGEQAGRAAQDAASALDSATRGVLPGGGKLGSKDAPATSSQSLQARMADKVRETADEIRARRESIARLTTEARTALEAINKKLDEGYDLYYDAAHPYIAVWKRTYRRQYECIGMEIAMDSKDPGVLEKALETARQEANSTDTRLLEAELLKMKGDTIGALMALRSAVASDPDHAVAKKMLQDAECAFLMTAIDKSQGAIQESRAAFYGYLLERGFTNAEVQVKGDWAFARGMSWAKSSARVYTEEAWAVFTTGLFGSFSVFTGKLEGEELLAATTEKQMVTAFVGLNTILRLRGNGYTFSQITNMTSREVRDNLPLRDYRGNLYSETNAANHCVAIREAMKLPDVQALIGVVQPEWVTKDRAAYTGDELALRLGVEKGYWNPKDVGDTWIEYIGDATSMYNLLLLLGGAKVGMEGRTASIFWSEADIAMMQALEKSGHVISGTEAVANSIGLTHCLGLIGQSDSGKGLIKALKKLDKYQAGLGTFDTAVWTAGKLTGMLTINVMTVIATEHLVGHKAAMLMQAALMFGSDFELLGKLLDSKNIPRTKVIELIINDYLPATKLHYKRLAQLNKNNLEIEQILARVKAGQKLSANDLAFLDTKIGHENWRKLIPDGKASTNAKFAQGAAAEGIENGIDNGAAAAAKKLETTLVEEQAATVKAEQDAQTLVEGLNKSAPTRGPPPPQSPPARQKPGTALITKRGAKEAMDPRATKAYPLPPLPQKGSQCAKAEALLHLGKYKQAQEAYEEILEKVRTGTGGLTEANEMPLEWIHLKRCLAYELQGVAKQGQRKLTPGELSKRFNNLIERKDVDEILSNPDQWERLGAGESGAVGNVYFVKGNKNFMVKSMGEEGMTDAENSIVHAALAAALELDTPGIEVRVLINEEGLIDKVYYVMRRVEGTRLDKKTAAEIFMVRDQLARHRALSQLINDYDRKIDNYFITADGRVYALDAGCADVTGARATSFSGLDDPMFNEGAYGRDHWLSRSYKDEICARDAANQPIFEKAPKIEVWAQTDEAVFSRKNLVAEEALTYNDALPTINKIHELVADEPKLRKILDDAFRKIHGTEREIEVKTKRLLDNMQQAKTPITAEEARQRVVAQIEQKITNKINDTVATLRHRAGNLDAVLKGLNQRNQVPLTFSQLWLPDDELTQKVVFLYILNHIPLRRAA